MDAMSAPRRLPFVAFAAVLFLVAGPARAQDGAVPFVLLGMLRPTVERRVASRDLPRALEALMRTDLALKTSAGEPRVLLERLIVELCETARER